MPGRSVALVIAIFSLLTFLMAACQAPATLPIDTTLSPTATPSPPATTPELPTPSPVPPTPTPTPLSAMDILEAANRAMEEANFYHMEMDMEMTLSGSDMGGEIEVPMTLIGDVQAPDRMKGVLRISAAGEEAEVEVVAIGEQSYVKDPLTGMWQVEAASATVIDPRELTAFEPSSVEDLEIEGQEDLNGTSTIVLSGRVMLPMELGDPIGTLESDLDVRYWIDQSDYTLVQGSVEGEMDLAGQVEMTITTSMTVRLSDYDVPVVVEPPEIATPKPVHLEGTLLPAFQAGDAEAYLEQGLSSLEDDRPGLAVAYFDLAIELQPDMTEAYLYRAIALSILGEILPANQDFAQVVGADSQDAETLLLSSLVLSGPMGFGLYSGASNMCVDLDRAVELDPELAQAWAVKAICHCASEEMDTDSLQRAFDDFETARFLDAAAADPFYAAIATDCFSEMYFQDSANQIEGVLDRIDRDIEQHPELPGGYLVRAEAILWLRDYTIEETIDAWIDIGRFLNLADCPTGPQMAYGFDQDDPLQVAGQSMVRYNCWLVDSAFDDIWDDEIDLSDLDLLISEDREFADKWSQLEEEFQALAAKYATLEAAIPRLLEINAVTFIGDGDEVATIVGDYYPVLINWDSQGEMQLPVELGERDSVAFSPNGRLIATGDDQGAITLWQVETGEPLTLLDTMDNRITAVSFSPDGALLVAASGESSFQEDPGPRSIRVWDVGTGELVNDLEGVLPPATGTGRAAEAIAVSPNGRTIALADEGVAYTVDSASGEVTHLLGEPCEDSSGCPNVHTLAISPDGSLLAGAGRASTVVRVWDLESGDETMRWEGIRGGGGPLAFSPDGKLLALGDGNGVVRVWDLKSGELSWLGGHRGGYPLTTGSFSVQNTAFSPDGARLISGGTDGTARIWDVETGEELQVIYAQAPE